MADMRQQRHAFLDEGMPVRDAEREPKEVGFEYIDVGDLGAHDLALQIAGEYSTILRWSEFEATAGLLSASRLAWSAECS